MSKNKFYKSKNDFLFLTSSIISEIFYIKLKIIYATNI